MSGTPGKAFVSWSGGKDSALACYRAMRNGGVEVAHLLNMLSEDGTHSRSHRLSRAVLQAQSQAMGLALTLGSATWQGYEAEFKKILAELRTGGVSAGVFGDIDVQPHRDWVERVCGESGMNAVLPLWGGSRRSLVDEFIALGFKAVIVTVQLDRMGEEWLGRELDARFVEDMRRLPDVDLCGENGEYHTFVYDGPLFTRPVAFTRGEKLRNGNHAFLDIVTQ